MAFRRGDVMGAERGGVGGERTRSFFICLRVLSMRSSESGHCSVQTV